MWLAHRMELWSPWHHEGKESRMNHTLQFIAVAQQLAMACMMGPHLADHNWLGIVYSFTTSHNRMSKKSSTASAHGHTASLETADLLSDNTSSILLCTNAIDQATRWRLCRNGRKPELETYLPRHSEHLSFHHQQSQCRDKTL